MNIKLLQVNIAYSKLNITEEVPSVEIEDHVFLPFFCVLVQPERTCAFFYSFIKVTYILKALSLVSGYTADQFSLFI